MVHQSIGAREGEWAGKTYEQIQEISEQPGSVLVLPVGSIEQHGYHLPTGTDTILVDAVAALGVERAAREAPVLVAPPVWSGYSPHHLPFGGTLSVGFETLLHLLEDIADSALENGFDALVLLNGHGGNASLISGATSTIGVEHPDVEVLGLSYFSLADSFIDEVRESEPGGMSHGGEFETSLVLHLRPELVADDRREAPYLDEPYERGFTDLMEGASLSVYRPFPAYSDTGAIGAPDLASAEKGAEIYDRLGDELADLLVEIHERNRS